MTEQDLFFVRIGLWIIAFAGVVVCIAMVWGLWELIFKKRESKIPFSEILNEETDDNAQIVNANKINWRTILKTKKIEIPENVKLMIWKHYLFSLPFERYLLVVLALLVLLHIHPLMCSALCALVCGLPCVFFHDDARALQIETFLVSFVFWPIFLDLTKNAAEAVPSSIWYYFEQGVLLMMLLIQCKILRKVYCTYEKITPEESQIVQKLNQRLLRLNKGQQNA